MPRSDAAGGGAQRVGTPAWILLDTEAVLADCRNATTASSRTSTGAAIQVTFFAADPPRDSFFCVHCDGGNSPSSILYSHDDIALLRVVLWRKTIDYFLYRAGRQPSLRLLERGILGGVDSPLSSVPTKPYNGEALVGILPLAVDGDHFVLAGLKSLCRYEEEGAYELHVFRSDHWAWTSTTVRLGREVSLDPLTKVIALGGGELGWVNLRKGILVCDVLGETPKPRAIPMPKLLPTNRFDLWRRDRPYQREYRDVVVYADGSIRCVELEHQLRRALPEMPDVSSSDVLHDPDLPMETYSDKDKVTPVLYTYLGWRIIVWRRTKSSTCWRKEHLVHVNDIVANDPGHTYMLREMLGEDDGDLIKVSSEMDVPSLSIDGGDVVYIMHKSTDDTDTKTWVVAVDMGRKTIVGVVPVSVQRGCSSIVKSDYLSCGLSRYMETD
ncbi:unnamed protein product [Urochloa humidicola]